MISSCAAELGEVAAVHLKVDTGLSRNGAVESDWPALVQHAAWLERDARVRVRRARPVPPSRVCPPRERELGVNVEPLPSRQLVGQIGPVWSPSPPRRDRMSRCDEGRVNPRPLPGWPRLRSGWAWWRSARPRRWWSCG
ncbi:alanine racemase [Saccharopolyspora shandongensis]|uniref:alanine racemase n=1 Tax=Saccharopolyspora shandongensis TaxID=418495 RepID=UPI00341ECC16